LSDDLSLGSYGSLHFGEIFPDIIERSATDSAVSGKLFARFVRRQSRTEDNEEE
jgi:hypothetical protein